MAAQAASLATAGARVRLLGFGTPEPPPGHDARIEVLALAGPGRDLSLPSGQTWALCRALARQVGQTVVLRRALAAALDGADLLLAQLPPVLPGLALGLREARRRQLPVVIDWHNLSAPMAALKLGRHHPAVGLLDAVEGRLARRAQLHLAVTPALAATLRRDHGIDALVLPDRPTAAAQDPARDPARDPAGEVLGPAEAIALLGAPALDPARRWRLVVSPTSWSLDEDMALLLDALPGLRPPEGGGLLLVATGKGPGRTDFEARAPGLERPGLRVATGWLPQDRYRALLRGADAGLCLHRSASGLDFPMKLADMAGAALPPLALDYGATLRAGLAELGGGATFGGAGDLTRLLQVLLEEAPPARSARPEPESWDTAWRRTALPALLEVLR